LQALPPILYPKDAQHTFQLALNQLDSVLNPKTALYLILRHEESLVAITFVPYPADADLKTLLLDNRQNLIKALGEAHFSSSIICKEIGEITDARSWEERSSIGQSWGGNDEHVEAWERDDTSGNGVHDLGHKKNKCRLCDRRMKNNIDDAALDALRRLAEGGDCVQLVCTLRLHGSFR
jgi:twinfilin-like protein